MHDHDDIAPRAGNVVEAASRAVQWTAQNAEALADESRSLGRDARRLLVRARKIRSALDRPMCNGVFGPSQSGKSYLISALARPLDGALLARFGDRTVDFVRDINPEGGRESTGLVTRFTVHPRPGPEGFPVQLRLLSEPDLVKIIANCFFLDCDHSQWEPLEPAVIQKRLDELQRVAERAPVDALTEDDVYDLQEYCDKTFESSNGVETVRRLRSAFWPLAESLAPRLRLPDRARLFALLWGDVPQFTQLYMRLHAALDRLGFAEEAWAPLEALLPREESVIDVAALDGLGEDGDERLALRTAEGRAAELGRREASALTAELTIPMEGRAFDFFEHTDLLDFPGARSREQILDLARHIQTPNALARLFLRCKVAYLFQRYCADRELTSMLLCVGPGNQEVRSLPAMVAEWIHSTHGRTPDERSEQLTALFLVLTMFDRELETKEGEGPPEQRWTTRLQSSLRDFLGKQHEWPRAWDRRGAFRNVFWLRNPNVRRKELFEYDERDDWRELRVRADEEQRLRELSLGFIANPDVLEHFEDPERAWSAALTPNDGGVGYLRDRLAPVCEPELKRVQLSARLDDLREELLQRLDPYHRSDDLEAERAKKVALGVELVQWLAKLVAAQRLGELIEDLQVQEEDLRDVFLRVRRGQWEGPDEAPPGNPGVGAVPEEESVLAEMLDGIETAAIQEAPAFEELRSGVAAEAELFGRAVMEHWIGRMHELARDERRRAYYLSDEQNLVQLAQELASGARRLGLRERITREVGKATEFRMKEEHGAALPVRLACSLVNDYVAGLGFDQLPLESRPAVGQPPHQRHVFAPRPESEGLPRLPDEPHAFERIYAADWGRALRQLLEDNAAGRGDEDMDAEQNRALGEILALLRPVG